MNELSLTFLIRNGKFSITEISLAQTGYTKSCFIKVIPTFVYSRLSLRLTPSGPAQLSVLERCPDYRA